MSLTPDEWEHTQEMAKIRESGVYEILRAFLENRLSQHYMSLASAEGPDMFKLQGACQELMTIIQQINDAKFAADEVVKKLAAASMKESEVVPLRQRQQAEFARQQRHVSIGSGGDSWDPSRYRRQENDS